MSSACERRLGISVLLLVVGYIAFLPASPASTPTPFQPNTSTSTLFSTHTIPTTPSYAAQTDWAVLSVSLNPSSPHVGDQVIFRMVIAAVSSSAAFPQSVQVGVMVDSTVVAGGTVNYPGPVGLQFTVSSQTPWTATPGPHTLTCGVASVPAGHDPDTSNNLMSTQFTVVPASTTATTSSGWQTDWAVTAVDVSPSAPTVGDQVTFSVVITALSSTGPFPQNAEVGGMLDSEVWDSGVVRYPGPIGYQFTVTSQKRWMATGGGHTFTVGVATVPRGLDPNPSNNMMSKSFNVSSAPQQPFDFSISVSPTQQAITPYVGQPGMLPAIYTITVSLLSGVPSTVTLSLSGIPFLSNHTLSPTSGIPSFTSTLTISVGAVAPRQYELTVTGTAGAKTHAATLILSVTQSQTTIQTPSNRALLFLGCVPVVGALWAYAAFGPEQKADMDGLEKKAAKKLRVGILQDLRSEASFGNLRVFLMAWLTERGYRNEIVRGAAADLSQYNVIVVFNQGRLSYQDVQGLKQFVMSGHGLVVAGNLELWTPSHPISSETSMTQPQVQELLGYVNGRTVSVDHTGRIEIINNSHQVTRYANSQHVDPSRMTIFVSDCVGNVLARQWVRMNNQSVLYSPAIITRTIGSGRLVHFNFPIQIYNDYERLLGQAIIWAGMQLD